MASTPNRRGNLARTQISARPSVDKDHLHLKYACGPLDKVHPFLTNSRCIEGRHASAFRRRTKSTNLRESKIRTSRDLHLEAIQREKSSRKRTPMPALQLRVSSGDLSIQKIKKRSRGSVLFFGKADHSADSPSPTNLSRQLPPVYKLDNSSFLDLFQGETQPSPSVSVSECQRASTIPHLSIRPVESSLGVISNSYASPVSPPTPDKHPWSPDDAYVNFQQLPTDAVVHAPATARSPSASSRGSDAPNGGPYFSSSASQSSQSSLDEGNTLPDSHSTIDANPKYLVEIKEQVCDLEVVQRSPKHSAGRRAFSEILSRNKPLPSEPLVDIASPFFEIACPAVQAFPRKRCSASEAMQGEKSRPRRSSSLSMRGRPNLPKLSTLSRGERLGLALTLHAQGMKIPNIVRHELPAQAAEFGEQSPESGSNSPISKLIAELENASNGSPESSPDEDRTVSKDKMRTSGRETSHFTSKPARSTDNLGTASAERIILNILSFLEIHDLLSTARVNRGFHSVFKKHELCLIKSAIFNTCPAAWEYLEEPGKGSIVPARYLEAYMTGSRTITSLRTALLIRCDALLRQETISGLIRADKEVSKKIDQAFWRISTFCEVFGHRSSRRDNTQAQIDWLREDRPSQTPNSNSTTLCSKSRRPLSSAELVDISEIWTCLANLLDSFHHQASAARDAGLFERCKIDETYNEDFYIKQWVAHVMTFGLSAIMELSSCSFDDARATGWTRWSPAAGTNKEPRFLTDAVASVYQLRLFEEAEAEANKVTLPRKASGRARSSRKRHTAHGDVLHIQTQNLPRKAVGSPARKPSLTQTHHMSLPLPTHSDSCSPILEGPRPPKVAAAAQQATRRRSAATPTITASMFQALSLQPGASTQIGPTLFPSISASPRVQFSSKEPRPITPLSSIQSTPIALTRPERVPLRISNVALSPEQPTSATPAPPVQSTLAVVSPIADPKENAMDLLVNQMGFPPGAVQDALASCDTEPSFDLDTVIAMLVSASSKPRSNAAVNATVKLVQPSELDSSPAHATPYRQLQTRGPSQEARRLLKKTQEKSARSTQTKLAEFAEGGKSKDQMTAQRRHSKLKAYQVLGVTQEPRFSTLVR